MFWNIFCDMYRWKIWYYSLCLFVMNVATSSWPLYWSAVDPSHTWDKVVHMEKSQVKTEGYHSLPTVNHFLPTLTLLGPVLIKINTVSVNLNNTRPSLILNNWTDNGIYRPWLPSEASAMTYDIYNTSPIPSYCSLLCLFVMNMPMSPLYWLGSPYWSAIDPSHTLFIWEWVVFAKFSSDWRLQWL